MFFFFFQAILSFRDVIKKIMIINNNFVIQIYHCTRIFNVKWVINKINKKKNQIKINKNLMNLIKNYRY